MWLPCRVAAGMDALPMQWVDELQETPKMRAQIFVSINPRLTLFSLLGERGVAAILRLVVRLVQHKGDLPLRLACTIVTRCNGLQTLCRGL